MLSRPNSKIVENRKLIEAVFDDFLAADLHEVILRDGVYLPDLGQW